MLKFINSYLEPFASFLFLLGVVFAYYRQPSKQTLLLVINHLLCTVLLFVGSYLEQTKKIKSNIWVYDLVLLSTALFVGLYFYRLLSSRNKRKMVAASVVVYGLYLIIHNLTLTAPRLFDSIGYAIVSASITLYAFLYFHQRMQHVTDTNLLRSFSFWLSSAYLLYYAGCFIIFVSFYYFTQKLLNTPSKAGTKLLTSLWGLHNMLFFISALSLLTGSLWVVYRKRLD